MDDVRPVPFNPNGHAFEELSVGQTAVYGKTVTEADLILFAAVSGDTNPVHINQDYADSSFFKGRIAHGMLSASFISTTIGTKLPGPGVIYMSQNLKFMAPVRIGDTVYARVTITDIITDKRRLVLRTTCTVGEKVVVDGEAVVWLPPTN